MMIGIRTTDIDSSITLNVAGYNAHSVHTFRHRIAHPDIQPLRPLPPPLVSIHLHRYIDKIDRDKLNYYTCKIF